jgi:RimJ/RimL family protein N-acetyltransferase
MSNIRKKIFKKNRKSNMLNKYKNLSVQVFSKGKYSIVPIRMEDRYAIMQWRNDQIFHLRQNVLLTKEDQDNYFDTVITRLFNQDKPKMILVSYLKNDVCIGYGGLTNIEWESKRGELSFLLDPLHAQYDEIYEKEFSAFIELIKQMVLDDLGFNRIFSETFDLRPLHISILEKSGFILEGRMRQHVLKEGKLVDSLIHGILKEQYVNRK